MIRVVISALIAIVIVMAAWAFWIKSSKPQVPKMHDCQKSHEWNLLPEIPGRNPTTVRNPTTGYSFVRAGKTVWKLTKQKDGGYLFVMDNDEEVWPGLRLGCWPVAD